MTVSEMCNMCAQRPATTVWGLPVCQPCADSLDDTQVMLETMEAEDPALAELGRRVEASCRSYLEQRRKETSE